MVTKVEPPPSDRAGAGGAGPRARAERCRQATHLLPRTASAPRPLLCCARSPRACGWIDAGVRRSRAGGRSAPDHRGRGRVIAANPSTCWTTRPHARDCHSKRRLPQSGSRSPGPPGADPLRAGVVHRDDLYCCARTRPPGFLPKTAASPSWSLGKIRCPGSRPHRPHAAGSRPECQTGGRR